MSENAMGYRDDTSCRNGAKAWASAAVAMFGRVGVYGQASLLAFWLTATGIRPKVLRGAGLISKRRNEHTSGAEPMFRVMETAKFGHDEEASACETVDMYLPKSTLVEILDFAEPGLRPVKPNKSLNLTLGLFLGGVCGSLLATILYALQRIAYRRALGLSRTQWPPRLRAVLHFLIALVVGVVVGYNCASPGDPRSWIAIPLALVLGGFASACIEFANAGAAPVPRKTELTLPDKY